jgi:copper chaperone CopZ
LVEELMKLDGTTEVKIELDDGTAVSALDYFQNAFDQWDDQDAGFTITADVDDSGAIAAMNQMLASGQITAD